MKTTFLAFCLMAIVCATVQARTIDYDSNDSPSLMDNIIRKALEYVRVLLKKQGYYNVPYEINDHFTDPSFDFQLKITELQLSKAEDFVINKLHNDVAKLHAEFDLGFPHPILSGIYEISGTVWGHKVQGAGKAIANLDNFDQKGQFHLKLDGHSLEMKELELGYSISDATFDIENIQVEGMTKEEVKEFLNKKLLHSLDKMKEEVCQKMATQVMKEANKILEGKTLLQIIDWLNHMMH